jgi:urease accessory protein
MTCEKRIVMKTAPSRASLPLAILLAAIPLAPALAHTGTGVAAGLESGFLHPLTGPDHLVAMVAVGLWGAQLGNPAIWVLPITFPLVMALGGLVGLLGVDLPLVEPVIAL